MDDDRIIGCLPGETPASMVMAYQELRHHRELTAAQARIEKLERMVVWCVEGDVDGSMIMNEVNCGRSSSILAAVEMAMGEK